MFEQFKFDYTYRFFMSNVASVEILKSDGSIRREIFPIPTNSQFLTLQTRKKILATSAIFPNNHFQKLKWLLKNTPLIKAEMDSQQSLART